MNPQDQMPGIPIQGPQDLIDAQNARKQGGGFSDWLPTIGMVGGGLIGGVPGAIIGGAGGEALKEGLSGQDLNPVNIAVQGGIGGIGEGVVGPLLGKAGDFLLSKGGGALGDYGSNLVTKGLNLTPKMEGDVAKAMGEKSLPEFLTKRGLHGANYEKIAAYTEPIQDQFDSIAMSKNIQVPTANIVDNFANEINRLNESLIPQDEAKAKTLTKVALKFIDQVGDQPTVGADVVTGMRKTVDKAVRDWGADPEVQSVGNITRNIFSSAVENADPTNTLDATGNELSKLYKLQAKAEPRQFVNTPSSTLPFGMRDASAGFIGNIFGGPVGAGALIGIEKSLNSPFGTRLVSSVARGVGDKVAATSIPSWLADTAGIGLTTGGAAGANRLIPGSGQETQSYKQNNIPQNSQDNQSSLLSTTGGGLPNGTSNGSIVQSSIESNGQTAPVNNTPEGVTVDQSGNYNLPTPSAHGVPQHMSYDRYIQLLQRAGQNPQLRSQVEAAYAASQNIANSYIQANALSPQEQASMRDAYNTNLLMNTIRTEMKSLPPSVLNRVGVINDLNMLGGPYAQLAANMKQLQAQIGKQLQGGVLRAFDMSFLNTAPTLGDTPQAAAAKLDNLQNLFSQQYMNLYPRYGLNLDTSMPNIPNSQAPAGQQQMPSYGQ